MEEKETVPLLEHVQMLKGTALDALGVQSEYDWMVWIFLILLGTAFTAICTNRVLQVAARVMGRTRSRWDDIAVESARKPLRALIWVLGVSLAVDVVSLEVRTGVLSEVHALREIAFVLLIGWGLLRFIRKGEVHFITQRRQRGDAVDVTAVQAVTRLLKISVTVSIILIALQNLGISIGGLLAFGGVGGIAVGFAAKDMLANFFGALIIYFDRPFKVGDWVRSPDKEIEGTVEDIGWRMTTIRTFDMRPLYVPNSVFTNISVENPSRMLNRRIYEIIGIRYADIAKMEAITTQVREMLQSHPDIDTTKTLMVQFDKFNESSLDFFVYTFTKTVVWTEFHEVKQAILLKIAAIIEAHGAEVAFPTRTVEMAHAPEHTEALGVE